MNRENFSAKEALALLGAEVSSFSQDARLPTGSQGRVVRVRKDHGASGFRVLVQWEQLGGVEDGEFGKTDFQRLLQVRRSAA